MANVLVLIQARDTSKAAFEAAKRGVDRLHQSVKNFSLANVAMLSGVAFGLNKLVKSYEAQEQATSRLEASMKNVRTAGANATEVLKAQASALQRVTKFGDEQIISAQAMLGTFQLNENQISAIIPRLLDMATATEKTTGNTADLEQVAIALGKAFTGQPGLLSRYGVVMDETAVKTQGFNGVLKSLDDNFKGMATTVADTATGKIRQFQNIWGDFQEQLGKFVAEAALPIISGLQSIMEGFMALPEPIRNTATAVGILAASLKALSISLGPAGWLVLGIGAAIVAFSEYSKTISKEVNPAQDAINRKLKEQLDAYNKINEVVSASAGVMSTHKNAAQITFESINQLIDENTAKRQEANTDWLEDMLYTADELYDMEQERDKIGIEDYRIRKEAELAAEVDAKNKLKKITDKSYGELKEQDTAWIEKYDKNRKQQLATEAYYIQSRNAAIIQSMNILTNAASTMFGEQTAAAKGALIAQAIMDTYAGANRALGAYPPPWSFILAAAVTAMGFANVTKIISGGNNFAQGGMVYAQGGMFTPRGTDTVPAMLTEGEAVIRRDTVRRNFPVVKDLVSGRDVGGGGGTVNVSPVFNISAIDRRGVEEFIRSADFRNSISQAIADGALKLKAGDNNVTAKF